MKHFIDLDKIPAKELRKILSLAKNLKKEKSGAKSGKFLPGKNLAMIFEKSSTRTRVSFEVGMNQLGGHAIVMNKNDMQLGKGEAVSDTAKVLSRFVDCIMIRANSHQTILELAKHSSIPVINALSDFSHPCQILASILTVEEHLGKISGKKLVWFGDQNNVLNSYIHAAKAFDFELRISSPREFDFCNIEIKKAQKNGAKIFYFEDAKKAAKDADVLITDTWFSMGDLSEQDDALKQKKINLLRPYQVNSALMKLAKSHAIFTHCLPAYRGFEVSADVIDSKKSAVFDEAENRLHIQKAILLWLMSRYVF
ncbi:MAG: ornithine carbamoyltransferase [Alphaproteobacteria bacterium RIFCSPLOWO2_01_FULL_40_26]|nr:MAG: ornithine carbamoyltransferase [Alphaproteobacteria bacterium RIFCSPHIGHO2_02_FULL_40_34]OFW95017.1 MAG: ornithine carbamoyltransferase [Alphaproteobacteria bacterium RIFCSPLOWO2_01_FULL_40_26]OFX10535.1 MAG: ornithine carbamoyltransferase [Alphaproteobacteria bacterium RIFCSPLOWO2_02_FULL_40_19]OFX12100.1 MAG: ornithine carbamoyltransferase [Alphaproteobacteria bacterium RIFCSPLOWO2_12_FULL_40_11]